VTASRRDRAGSSSTRPLRPGSTIACARVCASAARDLRTSTRSASRCTGSSPDRRCRSITTRRGRGLPGPARRAPPRRRGGGASASSLGSCPLPAPDSPYDRQPGRRAGPYLRRGGAPRKGKRALPTLPRRPGGRRGGRRLRPCRGGLRRSRSAATRPRAADRFIALVPTAGSRASMPAAGKLEDVDRAGRPGTRGRPWS
jgi:hypothetical protein